MGFIWSEIHANDKNYPSHFQLNLNCFMGMPLCFAKMPPKRGALLTRYNSVIEGNEMMVNFVLNHPQRPGDFGSGWRKRRRHSNWETGKMKFTVRRYDPVQTDDSSLPSTAKPDISPSHGRNGLGLDSADGSDTMDTINSTFYSTGAIGQGQDVAHRGRLYARRHKRRLVFKDGECNISLSNISKRKRRYLGDIFTTMLDMRWRYNLILFTLAFVITWLGFAFLYWLVAWAHSDHLHVDDSEWTPCMVDVHDFVTAFLFSLETQHTIGYGSRSMGTKCPEAILLLMIQSCTGVFIQSMMTGIIFAKLSRPKGRAHTIMFSKCAVICLRDGQYCLLFRVADMRKSHIVGGVLRATMVRNRITKEGELLPMGQIPLDVQPETCTSDGNIFLVWPVTVTHIINESSPFWEMSAESLLSERFEIVVFLEGTVESTGMTTQVRTSYLPSEILWGHRLAPLLTYQKENGQYKIDYTAFHTTMPVQTPECSAKAHSTGNYEDDIDGRGQGDNIGKTNYHTENCGVRRPGPLFKHRLHRRNTTLEPNALDMLEESEIPNGTVPVKTRKENNNRPKWMNGFVSFWSSSADLSKNAPDKKEVEDKPIEAST